MPRQLADCSYTHPTVVTFLPRLIPKNARISAGCSSFLTLECHWKMPIADGSVGRDRKVMLLSTFSPPYQFHSISNFRLLPNFATRCSFQGANAVRGSLKVSGAIADVSRYLSNTSWNRFRYVMSSSLHALTRRDRMSKRIHLNLC